jgi:flagellar hook assembly protein FlgD
VTPDFTGDITITGLTDGAQVKILATSGQLVSEGTSNSGSYHWNGCDQNGKKVASGVYMGNVATAEGESGIVTKISIVR